MKYVEDTLTEKVCDLLCRYNLPCRLAIALGLDGLCLGLDLPCLIYTLHYLFSRKFARK